MQTLKRLFICSAGAICLFVATALQLCNQAMPVDIEPLNDPIFHISLPRLFWIVSGVSLIIGLVCLLTRKANAQLVVVVLCAWIFLSCRIGVSALGISAGFAGYLGGVGRVYGISGGAVEKILCVASVYLLVGSMALFFLEKKMAGNRKLAHRDQR